MHRNPRRTFTLAMIGAVTCAVIAPAAVADEPEIIYLNGTVRDFRKSHPDFNITSGTGHVANNVALTSPNNRPVFTGNIGTAGFAVGSQWKNMYNQNIAPHMFFNGASLLLGSPPDYNPNNVDFYSYDSADGTTGPFPPDAQVVGAPMPQVIAPSGLPPHPNATGGNPYNFNLAYTSGANVVVDASFQVRSLATGQNVTITIAPDSDVIIYATRNIELGQGSKFVVPETSTLHLYFDQGGFMIGQGGEINMSSSPCQPDRCYLYNLGNSDMDFNQTGGVCAHIVSPNGDVSFHQANNFWGSIIADSLSIDQNSNFHMNGGTEMCGVTLADVVGSISSSSTGAISSNGAHFNEWFSDVLGTNVSIGHSIALVRNPSGIYEYLDPAFFPIDNELFGNEGNAHNFNFTFTFSASFEYSECESQFFEFSGADDVWVYIDGQLVMDLGGVMPLTPQVAEMDRLDLVDGETYVLHFYYAQRNPFTSQMNIRTNLPLESHGSIMATIPFD